MKMKKQINKKRRWIKVANVLSGSRSGNVIDKLLENEKMLG